MNLTNTCRTCLQHVLDEAVPITNDIYEFLELELQMQRVPRFHPQLQLPQSVCFDCYRNLIAFKRFYAQCRDAEEFFVVQLNKVELEESKANTLELLGTSAIDEAQQLHNDGLFDFIQNSDELDIKHDDTNTDIGDYQICADPERSVDAVECQYDADSTVEFLSNELEHEEHYSQQNESNEIIGSCDDKSIIVLTSDECIRSQEDINTSLLDRTALTNDNSQDIQQKLFSDAEIEENFNKRKRRFQCELCEKSFSSRYDLQMHENIHNGIKPFACEVCGKSFRQKNILRTHEALHFGKHIKCDECDKTFARKSQLIIHNRMHRNEKPFKCDYDDKNCGASFRERQHLISHQKTHTGIREHHCQHCQRAFYHRKGLLAHVRDVHGNVCYQCDLCPRAFNKPYKIRRHMLTAHDLQLTSVSHFKKTNLVESPFDEGDESSYNVL